MNSRDVKHFTLGAIIVASGLSVLAAVSIPNTFTAGTVIHAADVNANFSALKVFVDALELGKQNRVTGTCAAGSSIRVIAIDGTVTCEIDDGGAGGFSFGSSVSGAGATGLSVLVTAGLTTAIKGESVTTGTGLFGKSAGGQGVYGWTVAGGDGVFGTASSGNGVYGTTASGVGVKGVSTGTGKAGEFQGDLDVSGSITQKYATLSSTRSRATPIAYGNVDSGTAVTSATTPNVTAVQLVSTGIYDITIDAVSYDTNAFTTLVTAAGDVPKISTVSSISGKLRIYVFNLAGAPLNSDFNFVIFKN